MFTENSELIKVTSKTIYPFVFKEKAYTASITPFNVAVSGVGSFASNTYTIESSVTHVCGAHGFGRSLDDVCNGCQDSRFKSDLLHALHDELKEKKYIVEDKPSFLK